MNIGIFFDEILISKKGKILSSNFKNLYETMVSYEEKDRDDIKDLLNHKWFDEIKNLTDEDKKQMIKEAFEEKEKKKDEKTKRKVNPKHKNKNEAYNENPFFNNETEIRYEKNEKIFDKYIKINGEFNPIEFMNEYSNEMDDKFEIEKSKDNKLYFYIIKKKDKKKEEDGLKPDNKELLKYLRLGNDENIQKDLKIKIELIRINDGYLLLFNNIEGALIDYYHFLIILMNYAEEII